MNLDPYWTVLTLSSESPNDKALADYTKAIELDPKFIFAYRSLADLYWREKRYVESKQYIEVLVRFDPDDQNAREALKQVNVLISKQRLQPAS